MVNSSIFMGQIYCASMYREPKTESEPNLLRVSKSAAILIGPLSSLLRYNCLLTSQPWQLIWGYALWCLKSGHIPKLGRVRLLDTHQNRISGIQHDNSSHNLGDSLSFFRLVIASLTGRVTQKSSP